MKAKFLRYQYQIWCGYFGAAALLLTFGLLGQTDDTIRLYVGVGLMCSFFAGAAFGRTGGSVQNQRRPLPKDARWPVLVNTSEIQSALPEGSHDNREGEERAERFDF